MDVGGFGHHISIIINRSANFENRLRIFVLGCCLEFGLCSGESERLRGDGSVSIEEFEEGLGDGSSFEESKVCWWMRSARQSSSLVVDICWMMEHS